MLQAGWKDKEVVSEVINGIRPASNSSAAGHEDVIGTTTPTVSVDLLKEWKYTVYVISAGLGF